MAKALQWFMQLVMVLLPLILKAEDSGTAGTEKKNQVVAEVMMALKDPNVPFHLPSWLPEGVIQFALGVLVDVLVAQLNKSGFFGK